MFVEPVTTVTLVAVLRRHTSRRAHSVGARQPLVPQSVSFEFPLIQSASSRTDDPRCMRRTQREALSLGSCEARRRGSARCDAPRVAEQPSSKIRLRRFGSAVTSDKESLKPWNIVPAAKAFLNDRNGQLGSARRVLRPRCSESRSTVGAGHPASSSSVRRLGRAPRRNIRRADGEPVSDEVGVDARKLSAC